MRMKRSRVESLFLTLLSLINLFTADSELTSNRDDNTRRYLVSINSTIVQIQEDTHAPSNQYYREYGLKTSNFVPYPAFFPQIFVRYRNAFTEDAYPSSAVAAQVRRLSLCAYSFEFILLPNF